jgi:hypothetical protein
LVLFFKKERLAFLAVWSEGMRFALPPYEVLKPGGKLEVVVASLMAIANSKGAWTMLVSADFLVEAALQVGFR